MESAVATDVRGLLDRDDLLQRLDRAVTQRVTVISAPPGSGKTSLLRAWADRSTDPRRIAFVPVDRDQRSAQRFWCAVLDAIRGSASAIDPDRIPPTSWSTESSRRSPNTPSPWC